MALNGIQEVASSILVSSTTENALFPPDFHSISLIIVFSLSH